ncbi:MAG: hypothetical protein ABEK29_03415 [Bradymonadaceae bacterium]
MTKHHLPSELTDENVTLVTMDGTRIEGLRARVRGNEITIATQEVAVEQGDSVIRQFTNGLTRRYEITAVEPHESLEATVLNVVSRGPVEVSEPRTTDEWETPPETLPRDQSALRGQTSDDVPDLANDAFERCREAIETLEDVGETERRRLLDRLRRLREAKVSDADRTAVEAAYDRFVEEADDHPELERHLYRLARSVVRAI